MGRRWIHSVRTLCRAASAHFSPFRPKRRSTWLFCSLIPSMLKPSGLDRCGGKRPDEITRYPYSRGRCHIWDNTCVNTFASSKLIRSALAAAEVRKIAKYAELGRRYTFQPVAVETSCAMGISRIQFFRDLGCDWPCDFRITMRAISCCRLCL